MDQVVVGTSLVGLASRIVSRPTEESTSPTSPSYDSVVVECRCIRGPILEGLYARWEIGLWLPGTCMSSVRDAVFPRKGPAELSKQVEIRSDGWVASSSHSLCTFAYPPRDRKAVRGCATLWFHPVALEFS